MHKMSIGSFYKASFMFLVLTLLAGRAAAGTPPKPESVPEIHPGILQGYLPIKSIPNSLSLLPPPPAANSAALAVDEMANKQSRTLHGSARWRLAHQDSVLKFPEAAGTFSCALNAPITKQETPHLYMLLRRTIADAGLATYGAKNHYQRTRPFWVNKAPTCSPKDEEMLRTDGSYPSGHTAIGWAWALILSEIAPERSDAILARGWAFGESRMICNVHWQSDVTAGRTMGAVAVAKLHAEPTFRKAVEYARDELNSAHARNLPPTRDCKAEAVALAGAAPK